MSDVQVHHGDCIEVLRGFPDCSVDAVVTDPPYGLEFMGKGWDAPWRESDVNADAGMSATGYTDGGNRLERPSFTGSTNPKCADCKGTRRGRRDGTAKVAVCLCPSGGRFPNVRAIEMRAFGDWCELWTAECLRVLKPGGHLLAFGGTRTWHRLAVAVEDAGFEVRDSIAWLYGSGFPKSLDVSKAIDKAAGAERQVTGSKIGNSTAATYLYGSTKDAGGMFTRPTERIDITAPATDDARKWAGFGTALKPAFEPVVVARKPLVGTVAQTVLAYGTGALNIDGTRISHDAKSAAWVEKWSGHDGHPDDSVTHGKGIGNQFGGSPAGRWPANVVLDEEMAGVLDMQSGTLSSGSRSAGTYKGLGYMGSESAEFPGIAGDKGGASRFFYVAKAPKRERPVVDGVAHPTVKPVALMRWLVRLVTPPGGVVLEPFAGSGTTVEACILEGFNVVAIEREAEYLPLIQARIFRANAAVAEAADVEPDLFTEGEIA